MGRAFATPPAAQLWRLISHASEPAQTSERGVIASTARLLRHGACLLSLAVIASAQAQTAPKRILLVPVDDRPATSQFAVMIGQISDVVVETPPQEALGRFTNPGSPEKVLDWLDEKDLAQYDAVIVSTDMVCYGGLIASREMRVSTEQALGYFRRFQSIRLKTPTVPFYGFSALMRLAPTNTNANAGWREIFNKAIVSRELLARDINLDTMLGFFQHARRLPEGALSRYDQTRGRNHRVQQEILKSLTQDVFQYLIVGQDDAQPVGPHISEGGYLRDIAHRLDLRSRAYFCEGIDQHANVLLSRALVSSTGFRPRVKLAYADPWGPKLIPAYESTPVEKSLIEQVLASGAQLASNPYDYDYALYVNTPNPRPTPFKQFIEDLGTEIEQGFPVAVADINLGKTGTGDPQLFEALVQNSRAMKLLAYGGWNTAGNTLGTVIPAANVYLWSRKLAEIDPLQRELHQRAFLLHRLINDFEYHRYTRPQAYKLLEQIPGVSRDEAYGEPFKRVTEFVQQDVAARLDNLFKKEFAGQRFFAGTRQYELEELQNVNVTLPWPRPYEVQIGFSLKAREVGR